MTDFRFALRDILQRRGEDLRDWSHLTRTSHPKGSGLDRWFRLDDHCIMDIRSWLRSLGLERYEATFRENEIDATILHDLTEDHLRELGFPLGTIQ